MDLRLAFAEILQHDMALIIGQYSGLERSRQNAKDLWLPIKTSDTLVIHYRKWLDKYATATPFYRGYATHKTAAHLPDQQPKDVFSIHTSNCSACLNAYQMTKKIQKLLLILVLFICIPVVLITDGSRLYISIFVYMVTLIALFISQKIKQTFE